ncbi:hypothetical protein ACTHGU_14300 [Chitinophagaceae bacterium MMS25-I14]
MKNLTYSLLFAASGIMIIGAFTLCTKECPSYSNAIFQRWFPYTQGQVLMFKNPAGAAETMTIGITASGSYKVRASGRCSAEITVQSAEYYSSGASARFSKLYLHHSILSEENGTTSFEMNLFNSRLGNIFLTERGLRTDFNTWRDTLIAPYLFQGKYFDSVQVVTNMDTSAASGIVRKMYLSPNMGIIGYELKANGDIWVLQ